MSRKTHKLTSKTNVSNYLNVSQDKEREPMKIGYGRTSTVEQDAGLEAQLRDLKAAGVDKSSASKFHRSTSSAGNSSPRLWTSCVTEIPSSSPNSTDWRGSVRHLHEIVEQLKKKGVALQILNLGIDTNTPTGKLMLTMLGGIAEFEREIMLERQKEGVAKAKRDGKYMGRKPTVQLQADAIRKLNAEGKSKIEIAAELGIHRSGVYRVLDKESDVEAQLEGKLKAWRKRGKNDEKDAA